MHGIRGRIQSQARPALVWTLVSFLAGHLILGMYLTRYRPELCDPEFHLRLRDLRARVSEASRRPLALVLGSSRVAFGLRPESAMGAAVDDTEEPILFNFALVGSGPVGERLVLHRVLEKGIKPQWAFIEVWAPFLAQSEEGTVFGRELYWSDLPTISRLYHRLGEAAGGVFAKTVAPALHYRMTVLNYCVPSLVPPNLLPQSGFDNFLRVNLDGFGWMPYFADHPTPAEAEAHVKRAQWMKSLLDKFCIHSVSNKALHEMLEECQANNIRVALLLMPEHSLLRGWYSPIQAELTAFLRSLSEEYQVPVFDARTWCADDDIPDCCHLSQRGARSFSERFGREIYRPLLQGRPPAKNALLCGPSCDAPAGPPQSTQARATP